MSPASRTQRPLSQSTRTQRRPSSRCAPLLLVSVAAAVAAGGGDDGAVGCPQTAPPPTLANPCHLLPPAARRLRFGAGPFHGAARADGGGGKGQGGKVRTHRRGVRAPPAPLFPRAVARPAPGPRRARRPASACAAAAAGRGGWRGATRRGYACIAELGALTFHCRSAVSGTANVPKRVLRAVCCSGRLRLMTAGRGFKRASAAPLRCCPAATPPVLLLPSARRFGAGMQKYPKSLDLWTKSEVTRLQRARRVNGQRPALRRRADRPAPGPSASACRRRAGRGDQPQE